MAFYPFSIPSYVPLAIAYAVMLLLYGFFWWLSRAMKARAVVRVIAAFVLLLVPISEELWIAWNFGQACKDAGTFIGQTVEVDGFYDDTSGWGPRQLSESKYKFMESRDGLNRRLLRVEPADSGARDQALAWYDEKVRARQHVQGPFVVYQLSEKEQIVVAPNRASAWRVTTINHPSARYQYRLRSHVHVARKVVEHESIVIDTRDQSIIGREKIIGRYAPWFFIGLDAPQMQCVGKNHLPGLVYQHVLLPSR